MIQIINPKIIKQPINGILLLNKLSGISSNGALQKVKRLFNAKKAGHTGTLDPMATGLLPICFGEATKFSSYLLDGNKEYIATIKLGVVTTTYDIEGEVVKTMPVNIELSDIENAVNSFMGKITQVPPKYSALKVNGKALYEYARANLDVEIKSRQVEIYETEILNFNIEDKTVTLRVLCSKGTYIRSLAYDIGDALGCGACLIGLERTKSNQFILDRYLTLEYLSQLSDIDKQSLLLDADVLVNHLPKMILTEEQYAKIKFGNPYSHNLNYKVGDKLRAYYNNHFLGVVTITTPTTITPSRLILS